MMARFASNVRKRLVFLITVVTVLLSCVHGNSKRARLTGQQCAIKFQKFPGHTACLDTSENAIPYELTDKEKEALVGQHNHLRSTVQFTPIDMLKMSWDDEVAMIAKKWTDSCLVIEDDQLVHEKNYQRFIPGRFSVGQNLAMGHRSFADAVDAWYAEEADYRYGTDYSRIRAVVGHYTQMVWAKSYKLGCSKTVCSGIVVYACNYAPAGNVVPFTQPYRTGGAPICQTEDTGLCDCSDLECVNGSPLNVRTCQCDCSQRYSLGKDCKLSCNYTDPAYCGTHSSFEREDCIGQYTASVAQRCPKMCDVCPYALEGHGGGIASPTLSLISVCWALVKALHEFSKAISL